MDQADDLLALIDLLRDYNVALVSVTEPFDTTNSIGKAMLQLIGVFAELERGMISERTRDKIYEYACHEGNHSLTGIMAGARTLEREAASGDD